MKDKLGEGLGIWYLEIGGADLELKPAMKHTRSFRNNVLMAGNIKNRTEKFDNFEEWMKDLICEQHPNLDQEKVFEYVSLNCNELFEETMLKLRWTTKEDLSKAKKKTEDDIKKFMDTETKTE